MGVANRDIKLENILLKAHDIWPMLKICDFGYSINENHSLPKTALGTPGYTGKVLFLSKLCSCLIVVVEGLVSMSLDFQSPEMTINCNGDDCSIELANSIASQNTALCKCFLLWHICCSVVSVPPITSPAKNFSMEHHNFENFEFVSEVPALIQSFCVGPRESKIPFLERNSTQLCNNSYHTLL